MTDPARNVPLTAEDVKLLMKGDWLRVVLPPATNTEEWCEKNEPPLGTAVRCAGSIEHQVCVFLVDYEPGFGWHRSRFAFLARPANPNDPEGWVAHDGGENPAPGMRVQVLLSDLTGDTSASDLLQWRWSGKVRITHWRPCATLAKAKAGGA